MAKQTTQMSALDRMYTHMVCDIKTKCHLWTGCTDKDGYGKVRMGERTMKAHRAAYELEVGPIGEGLVLDHVCKNRTCCYHLEEVTQAENVKRIYVEAEVLLATFTRKEAK